MAFNPSRCNISYILFDLTVRHSLKLLFEYINVTFHVALTAPRVICFCKCSLINRSLKYHIFKVYTCLFDLSPSLSRSQSCCLKFTFLLAIFAPQRQHQSLGFFSSSILSSCSCRLWIPVCISKYVFQPDLNLFCINYIISDNTFCAL